MIDILVVGYGFGAAFAPIYRAHPVVGRVGVVDPDPEALRRAVQDGCPADACWTRLEDAIAGGDWDAVHLLPPVTWHADQTELVLRSGRHCACAVPAATTIEDLQRVVRVADASAGRYMMMETALFSREYFLARDLHRSGALGRLTWYEGAHLQNLDGFPEYWRGYPPMKYLTHALSPALFLAEAHVSAVSCVGSSPLTPRRIGAHGPGWGIETGMFRLTASAPDCEPDLVAHITTSFAQLGRGFYEGFSIYGDEGSLEWPSCDAEPVRLWTLEDEVPGQRGRRATYELVDPPVRDDMLPASLAPFADGRHGGSHPHLVHEFVSAIAEDRPTVVDAVRAAQLVAPGICAHESARHGGEWIEVPDLGAVGR